MSKAANLKCDILLVGQPNVGKSVLFSRLTGIHTIASNYPGTTVGYTEGKLRYKGNNYDVIDAPGTYYLEPLDEAARVAIDLLDKARSLIVVVDATHLERHLPLTLEFIAQKRPMVVALNMWDEARHKGIAIAHEKLSVRLKVPVIPCVARTGEGVKTLIHTLFSIPWLESAPDDESDHPGHHLHIPRHDPKEERGHAHLNRYEIWQQVGEMVREVQTLRHRHHSAVDWLEDITVHPLWGMVVALFVLGGSFSLVRLMGEFLIAGSIGIIGEPWLTVSFGTEFLFEKFYKPLLLHLSAWLGENTFWHAVLIGALIEGDIDFMQSFGLLTSGLFIPLGVVFPYIVSFYFILCLLEESGYLPRLAVFMDSLMHRVGLHGYAVIPNLLGLGCNIPGILATRILETKRQRLIAATLISIAVPCAALQAMILKLAGDRGFRAVFIVYFVLLLTWIIVGIILRFTVGRGFQPELLVEIPPFRLPYWRGVFFKMTMRLVSFLEAELLIVLAAVFIVNILYQAHLFDHISVFFKPVITDLWGMPKEATVPLLLGLLRKDVAVGMLAPLSLTTKQVITGCIVLAMFFPCIATFAILYRELGVKDGLKSTGIMLLAVLAVGATVNFLL